MHRCSFCGWHRAADSSVMLSPHCARCGCVLAATDSTSFEQLRRSLGATASPPTRSRSSSARVVRAVVAASIVLLTGVAGYLQGGLALAAVMLGAAGLLTVRFGLPSGRWLGQIR